MPKRTSKELKLPKEQLRNQVLDICNCCEKTQIVLPQVNSNDSIVNDYVPLVNWKVASNY